MMISPKKWIVASIVLAVILIGYHYFPRTTVEQNRGLYKVFDLNTQGQGKLTTKDLKDRAIILNFWASWCPPCMEEMPSLLRLVEKQAGRVILIAVSGDDSPSKMNAFLRLLPLANSPYVYVLHDPNRIVFEEFKIEKMPETFIFDSNHQMVQQLSGAIDFNASNLGSLLTQISAKKTD